MKTRIVLSLVVAVSICRAPAVLASSPCDCDLPWSSPQNETTDVPTNIQVLLSWPGAVKASISFQDQANPPNQVAFQVLEAGWQEQQFWLAPDAPLEAQTVYEIRADNDAGSSYYLKLTTGDVLDLSAPQLGTVQINAGSLIGACAQHTAAVVSVTGASDDKTPESQLAIQVDVEDPEMASPRRTIFLLPGFQVIGETTTSMCLKNYLGAQAEKEYQATVTVLDWAANPSDSSDPLPFTFRLNAGTATSTGCLSTTGADTHQGLLVLGFLAGLILLVRRRARR